MKLKDLQEAFDTQISNIDYDGHFPFGYIQTKDDDALGHGEFSRVTQDKDDPHMVDKQQLNRTDRSGSIFVDMFDQYAEIIAEERLWEMIHFPRVYAIKKYTDEAGEVRNKWKMEKLIELDSLDQEEIKRMTHRYFIPEVAEEVAELDAEKEDQYHYSNFADAISVAIHEGEWDHFRDKTLEKAAEKLEDIYTDLRQNYGYDAVALDLHSGNIMVRRTQNGLQVVFSDPFAGRKQYM
jgi:hypothetical protein